MGLGILIAGLAVLLGAHVFVAMRERRAALIARIGEGAYKGLFSLVSFAGLLLIGYGYARYRATGWVDLWVPPSWMRHVTVALMWPAIVLVAAAYLPGRIKRAMKHPMLVGVKLWAFSHLLSNGDLGSVILFGSVLAWAVFDRIAVKRREAGGPAAFLAEGSTTNDILALAVGTLVYLALGYAFHPAIIGVRAFGG